MAAGGGTGTRRPFVAIDEGLLESELVRSFTALQRSVVLALYELANWGEAPWIWRGRTLGVVGRGETTHALRSIAERAKVSKDVADGVVKALLRAGYLFEILGPTEPTTEPTTDPTPEPTHKPTTPRKLRLVHFLGNRREAADEPTTDPTPEPTPEPPPDPTEIRRADVQTSHEKLLPSPAAPARRAARRKGGGEPDPRHRPLQLRLEAAFRELRGDAYGFHPRDARALTELLRLSGGDVAEVERRWRRALVEMDKYRRCDAIHELADRRWNAHAGSPRLPDRSDVRVGVAPPADAHAFVGGERTLE
jgi:hypothetical protein